MKRQPLGRLVTMLAAMILALAGIFARLTVLQVSRAEQLRSLARDQRVRTVELPAQRGEIRDRFGHVLAVSLEARDVYAERSDVEDPLAEAQQIAMILGVRVRDVISSLRGEGFAFVARQVDRGLADRIATLDLPGIGLLPVAKRYYPAGHLAGQVLGFVGVDGQGLDGLEAEYQSLLAGRPGERTEEVDPDGRPIPQAYREVTPPVPGSDLWLTIDPQMQFQAEAALKRAVEENHAKGGTVIVMDPKTGEILAMAVHPTFDPNRFQEFDEEVWRNRAVTDAIEPGSVNKVITASAAVDQRAVTLEERFVVPDHISVGGFTIHDSHAHAPERLTLGDIVAESSNVGIIKVADELGADRLARYLSRFGFGQETGLGFPGESTGLLLPLYEWSASSLPTIAFGQGISVTPLQMASVYATVANGGEWVQPRLVKGVVGADGEFTPQPSSPTRRVVSRDTAGVVTEMLAYAVEAGTGEAAQIPGYQVAGKTGTARKPYADRPGYSHRYVASFIGFLPASEPSVVIAAMLDEPVTVYGGLAAAPLFRDVARYAVHRLQIPTAPSLPRPPSALKLR